MENPIKNISKSIGIPSRIFSESVENHCQALPKSIGNTIEKHFKTNWEYDQQIQKQWGILLKTLQSNWESIQNPFKINGES